MQNATGSSGLFRPRSGDSISFTHLYVPILTMRALLQKMDPSIGVCGPRGVKS